MAYVHWSDRYRHMAALRPLASVVGLLSSMNSLKASATRRRYHRVVRKVLGLATTNTASDKRFVVAARTRPLSLVQIGSLCFKIKRQSEKSTAQTIHLVLIMSVLLLSFVSLTVCISSAEDSEFLRMLDHDFERNRLRWIPTIDTTDFHDNRASPILSLGRDVWVEIVGYLNHRLHFVRAMLSCQRINQACCAFLDGKFVYLLNTQCTKQKKFRTPRDVITNIPMISRVYLDLEQKWGVLYLLRMYDNNTAIIRGFDCSSGLPFLSIRLVDKIGFFRPITRALLLVIIFDQDHSKGVLIFRGETKHETVTEDGAFDIMYLDSVLFRNSIYLQLPDEGYLMWAMERNWYITLICEKFRLFSEKFRCKHKITNTNVS